MVGGDLTSIGGNASQAFTDNGNGSFSYAATVAAGTTDGSKTLPITITDDQHRTGSLNIALNVATPFVAPSVKISQVYGGGGNSGATYLNDFVELFNSGTSPVDVTNWSVQEASATSSTWNVVPLCQTGSCVMPAGHYFLVWESAGTGTAVQVPLPAADAIGTATMSASSAKVALMANTTPLSGLVPDWAARGSRRVRHGELLRYANRAGSQQHDGRRSARKRVYRHRQQQRRFHRGHSNSP